MNLQNVAKIVMPDGEVKAIHNSNGYLLWGKVNYGVKYLGNTEQNGNPTPSAPIPVKVATGNNIISISDGINTQSYEVNLGKNLINGSDSAITQRQRVTTTASGNGFTMTSTASSGACYATIPIPNIRALLGKTVHVSFTGSGSGINTKIYYLNASSSAASEVAGYSGGTITLPSSLGSNSGIGVIFYTSNNSSATYTNIQLEVGSTATDYASYFEPIELCKIGTHQDYIYKSGEKWYKHKAVEKVILDGVNKSFSDRYTTASSHYRFVYSDQSIPNYTSGTVAQIYCDSLIGGTMGNTYNRINCIAYNDAGNRLILYISSIEDSTLEAANTWLKSNPITVYYILATAADEEITNSTLVSQLEDAQRWLIRYGYSSQVSGDLPIIIGKTEL